MEIIVEHEVFVLMVVIKAEDGEVGVEVPLVFRLLEFERGPRIPFPFLRGRLLLINLRLDLLLEAI